MTLNSQQTKAKEKLNDFIKNPKKQEFLLEGYAGTGKTYSITNVLYQSNYAKLNVCFTATTNKAVSVLNKKGSDNLSSFRAKYYEAGRRDYKTIHKLLSMEREIQDNGDVIFVPQIVKANSQLEVTAQQSKSKYYGSYYDYDIIVIDECSMVSDIMYSCIQSLLNGFGPKIIWLGDRFQLPPINESLSKVFRPEEQLDQYLLTTIERSKNKNIEAFQLSVRNSLQENKGVAIGKFKKIKTEHFNVIKNDKTLFFKEYIDAYLECEKNKKSPPICLAYTNTLCNSLNNDIRKLIMLNKGEITKDDYMIGELIVFNNFYKTLYATSYYSKQYCREVDTNSYYNFYTSVQAKVRSIDTFTISVPSFKISSSFKVIVDNNTPKDISLDMMAPKIEETNLPAEDCPICLENKESNKFRITLCNHRFCTTCIKEWLEKNKACPMCRMNLKDGKLYLKANNILINSLLDEFYQKTQNINVECWKLGIKVFLERNDNYGLVYIYVPKNKKEFRKLDKEITNVIKNLDRLSKNQKTLDEKTAKLILKQFWKYYYEIFKDKFADIAYGYAITTHKSQGSTYENCFVHMSNIIGANKKRDEALRCLYTSVTRPSNSITLFY